MRQESNDLLRYVLTLVDSPCARNLDSWCGVCPYTVEGDETGWLFESLCFEISTLATPTIGLLNDFQQGAMVYEVVWQILSSSCK